jgi:hypothetical protein
MSLTFAKKSRIIYGLIVAVGVEVMESDIQPDGLAGWLDLLRTVN